MKLTSNMNLHPKQPMHTYSQIHIRCARKQRSISRCAAVLISCLGVFAAIWATPVRAELSLLMFEEAGCVWCARWNAEVGPEYPVTPEGLAAPLRRLDIHDPLPAELALTSRPRFTPTFILVDDGAELGRIEGYPGEDFFWGLLARLIDQAAPAD